MLRHCNFFFFKIFSVGGYADGDFFLMSQSRQSPRASAASWYSGRSWSLNILEITFCTVSLLALLFQVTFFLSWMGVYSRISLPSSVANARRIPLTAKTNSALFLFIAVKKYFSILTMEMSGYVVNSCEKKFLISSMR